MSPKKYVAPTFAARAREHVLQASQMVEKAAAFSSLTPEDKGIVSMLYVLVDVVEVLTERLLAKYD